MRNDGIADVECLDEFFPGVPVEIEHRLMLLDALFFDGGDFAGVGCVFIVTVWSASFSLSFSLVDS